jgi:23S rRNA (uracil1939-C5)-methyltransferase
MLNKNQTYTVKIEKLGTKGEGIAYIDNYLLQIKNTLPGETVEVQPLKLKKNHGIAKLIKIKTKSPNRTNPFCDLFAKCGGCQLQHLTYQEQLNFKTQKIKSALDNYPILSKIKIKAVATATPPIPYRNKAQFAVGESHSLIKTGLFSLNTHNIIDTETCHIQHPKINEMLKQFRLYLKETQPSIYNEPNHFGLIRHILLRTSFSTNECLACVIINGEELPEIEKLLAKLQNIEGFSSLSVNINQDIGDKILGNTTDIIWGNKNINEEINDINFSIPAQSFFQVNPIQTQTLIDLVIKHSKANKKSIIWDAYCGIGTFSLPLAKKAKHVYGIEIVEESILQAQANAKQNNLSNTSFFTGKVEHIFPDLAKIAPPEIIILDPPRKGCDQITINTILKTKPKRIIYISCNPITLARDLNDFISSGYSTKHIQPIDMFPHTIHIENICILELQ